jgi:hypothetical protein
LIRKTLIKIDLRHCIPYPEEIKILLQGTDSEGGDFRENIRNHNNAIAFALMGADIVSPSSNGLTAFEFTDGSIIALVLFIVK